MKSIFYALILLLMSGWAQATIDAYPFTDEGKEAQFKELINELRCPKCQNQTISDSDAPLAKDLKDKTYEMVQQGAAKDEVIHYMVDRYGNFVHYQPPIQGSTWILWFGPFVFLLLAIVSVTLLVRSKAKQSQPVSLSAEEQQRLSELLKKDNSAS